MTTPAAVAGAIAFFERCDDPELLRSAINEVAPRARRLVADYARRGHEDRIPPPADIEPAETAATREEALRILRTVNDFAQLQAIARAAGRRLEELRPAAEEGAE